MPKGTTSIKLKAHKAPKHGPAPLEEDGIRGELLPHRPWISSERQTNRLRKIRLKPLKLRREQYLHGFIIAVAIMAAIVGGRLGISSSQGSSSGDQGLGTNSSQKSALANQSRIEAVDVLSSSLVSTSVSQVLPTEQSNAQTVPSALNGNSLIEMRNTLAQAALELPLPPADVLDKLAASHKTEQKTQTYTVYTIQPGDTLIGIARRFGISTDTLLWNNNELRDDLNYLKVGLGVTVPAADGIIYNVRLGDSLQKIASTYGIDASAIANFGGNNITNSAALKEGAVILLPGAKPLSSNSGSGTLALASTSTTSLPTPKPAPSGPVYDGSLWVGASVQVTPGGCLNARSEPGGDLNTCIPSGSVQTIVDGPAYANGNWWWYLRGQGWAVDSYLATYSGSASTSGPSRSATSYGFIWPTTGSITDGFGVPRGGGTYHTGIDIALPGVYGRAVVASAGGRVELAQIGYGGGLGNHVIIAHDNGLETVYAHLSVITVSGGEYVSQGELIGYTGCTGYCLGEHLHFEVRLNGVPVNPLNYLP